MVGLRGEMMGRTRMFCHPSCQDSAALSTAALMALIMAARNPPFSSASTPLMVVPAGEATAFFTYVRVWVEHSVPQSAKWSENDHYPSTKSK